MAPSTPSSHAQIPGARKKRWRSPVGDTEPKVPDVLPASLSDHPNSNPQRDGTSTVVALQNPQDDTQGAATTHSDPSSGSSHESKTSRFLSLPYELLHTIASELCGTKAILNLALVNKHINGIAQQALVEKLIIPKNHIKKLLAMLINHQNLIGKVTTINLGDYACGHYTDCLCLGKPDFDPDALNILGTAMATNTEGVISWRDVRQGKYTSRPVWRKNHAFFLDILLSLCPNIKTIIMELPDTGPYSSHPPAPTNLGPSDLPAVNAEMVPMPPFLGPALWIMQQRLEALTIAEDSRWKGPAKLEILSNRPDVAWRTMGKNTITLSGFVKLKRLDIPMIALGRPESILFLSPGAATVTGGAAAKENGQDNHNEVEEHAHPLTKTLPLTLRYLHLRSCNQWTFALLQKLNEIPADRLKLKHIELFFKTCPRSSISQCCIADEGQLHYPRILSELADKGIKIAWYTGPNEMPFDMHKELVALSVLSSLEVWRFAIWGRFSALNMTASIHRRSSFTAHQLFMKHAPVHFRLMNKPTFDGKAWVQAAFFHGAKNTTWDLGVLPHKPEVRTLDANLWFKRALGKREAKRRLPALLDLSNASFNFRFEQHLAPRPTNTQFLGVIFVSQNDGNRLPKDSGQRSKQRSCSEKDDEKMPGQGHCLDRAVELRKRREKSLEQRMKGLRLDDDHERSTSHAHEVRVEKGSKFDGKVWSGINWKAHLRA